MADRGVYGMVYGDAELRSPFMSNHWRLLNGGQEVATLQRIGRLHISRVYTPDGDEAVLTPFEHSTVVALDPQGRELARIVRTSWFGRSWEIDSQRWVYELKSDPRPRRWHVNVAGTSVARMSGSMLSYNRVRIEAPLGLPILVVALAWHSIARPWEAAAAPSTLIATEPTPGLT